MNKLFKFTEPEERCMQAAIEDAREYMKTYGKGDKPRRPGMYYRPTAKPTESNEDESHESHESHESD